MNLQLYIKSIISHDKPNLILDKKNLDIYIQDVLHVGGFIYFIIYLQMLHFVIISGWYIRKSNNKLCIYK